MEVDDIYHYDFTTASELEIFIAGLEEIILEWGLHQKPLERPLQKDDFKTKQWLSSSDIVTFSGTEFILRRYYLKCDKEEEQDESEIIQEVEEQPAQAIQDILSMENDFFPITDATCKDSHPVARWYGLRDFLVLIPQHRPLMGSESKVKVLLSAITIAINNTQCAIPFFLMASEPWQNYFLGVFRSGSFLTEFNMVHLKRTPLNCKFLTGLLTMFKSKIGVSTLLNPVTVSVRFTYTLKDWSNSTFAQEFPFCDFLGDVLEVKELHCLPFGTSYDLISELHLNALWPSLLENSVVDSENYSDLDPLQAPIWKISITTVDDPSCLLTDYYTEFLTLTKEKGSLRELLGDLISRNSKAKSSEMTSLRVLTKSKITSFSKAVMGNEKMAKKRVSKQAQQPCMRSGPISSQNLEVILYYLFPDADSDSKSPYSENLGRTLCSDLAAGKKEEDLEKRLNGMKSAPFDGLLWRLSLVMAHVIHSVGGVQSAAYLWYEFTQELRFRWENGILVPGLHQRNPDLETCLLNQKLQFLNCCISKRIEREAGANEKSQEDEDEDSESDEEFYDCDADINAPLDKPVGRLSRYGDLKLLKTGTPLYIPVTKDFVPRTEDELKMNALILGLPTVHQTPVLPTELINASLLSDMEAFKAANPGCIMADFIRWYSPTDWIEEDSGEVDEFGQQKGHLSKRMEIASGLWDEVWQVAKPVPVKWQKRCVDDSRDSENVLDFLETKTPKEFIELLLPVMIVCVIRKLLEESASDEIPGIDEMLSKLINKAEMLGRMPKIEGSLYEQLIDDISAVETTLAHAKSLKHKFISPSIVAEEKTPENKVEEIKFIKSLLAGAETEVPGGPKSRIGLIIRHYFSEAMKAEELILDTSGPLENEKWNAMSSFPSPHEKEMILRLSTAKGPQRLHAVLKKNECRLCGAFTRNVYLP